MTLESHKRSSPRPSRTPRAMRDTAENLGLRGPGVPLLNFSPASAQQGGHHRDAILDQQFGDLSLPQPAQHSEDWSSGLAERAAPSAARPSRRLLRLRLASVTMAAISELAMSTLVARGIPLRRARVIAYCRRASLVGHVLEEQAARPDGEALKYFDLAAFTEQHPTVVAAVPPTTPARLSRRRPFRECLRSWRAPRSPPRPPPDPAKSVGWGRSGAAGSTATHRLRAPDGDRLAHRTASTETAGSAETHGPRPTRC